MTLRSNLVRLLAIAGVGALALPAAAEITVDNFQPGDVVRYPVVVLRGKAPGNSILAGRDLKNGINFPVMGGGYAATVELKPGVNMVAMKAGLDTMKIRIDYRPMKSPYTVRAVWLRASDEGDTYYAAAKGEQTKVREKFDVAMKLLQSFTAEAMNAAGYGRKTFPLELDKNGKVVVHFIASPKTGAELRAMENNASWFHIYDLMKSRFPEATNKWCVLFGWTGFDAQQKKWLGHYALGGGALGAFGSGSMTWWAPSLKELPKALSNPTVINPETQFEDSAYRRTAWANYSTALGAMIHEMGHTFGLPHSADPFSVMSRGFDHFNRTFFPMAPPHARQPDWATFKDDERSRWDPGFAARLNWSPFFQPDGNGGKTFVTTDAPSISLEGDEVIIRAPHGLRVWSAEHDARPQVFSEFKNNLPTVVRLVRADLRSKLDVKDSFRVVAVDNQGNQTSFDIKP